MSLGVGRSFFSFRHAIVILAASLSHLYDVSIVSTAPQGYTERHVPFLQAELSLGHINMNDLAFVSGYLTCPFSGFWPSIGIL